MANPIADAAARLSVAEHAIFALAYRYAGYEDNVIGYTVEKYSEWKDILDRLGEDRAYNAIPELVKDFTILVMNDRVQKNFVRTYADRLKAKKKERS